MPKPKYSLCNHGPAACPGGKGGEPCGFAHNLWELEKPDNGTGDLWKNTYDVICGYTCERTVIICDRWMGQRYTKFQVRKLGWYYQLHLDEYGGRLPEWAEGAARLYLHKNPYPIANWDHGLVADHNALDGPRLGQLTSMLEPNLWDRLHSIYAEAGAFWTCTDVLPDDLVDLDLPIINDNSLDNSSGTATCSSDLRPVERAEDPIVSEASIGNYSTTAIKCVHFGATEIHPLDRTGDPIMPDPQQHIYSVTAIDDRSQGSVVAVAKSGGQSMGERGIGHVPWPWEFGSTAAENEAADVCEELYDSPEAMSSIEGGASTDGVVDRFTIDV